MTPRHAAAVWTLAAILLATLLAARDGYRPGLVLLGLAIAWPVSTLPRLRWGTAAGLLLGLDGIGSHVAGEHVAEWACGLRGWPQSGPEWSAGYLLAVALLAGLPGLVAIAAARPMRGE